MNNTAIANEIIFAIYGKEEGENITGFRRGFDVV